MSPVDNVRDHVIGDQPWLATDPTLGPWQEPTDLDVVHTDAWNLPDERPLPAELEAFLDAGAPPVYVGFGSMRRVSEDIARVAIEAIRAQGRRALVGRGWADLGIGAAHDGPTPTFSDHRVPVSRAQDDPDPRDPRTSGRHGRHDPHRRRDGGRDAAARRGQPRKAASVRVNHAGSSSQGKRPAPGCTANSARSKRPAYSAFRGGSPTSYSPASNSTGLQDHSVRSSKSVFENDSEDV